MTAKKRNDEPKELDFRDPKVRAARAKGEPLENVRVRSPYARKDAQGGVAHGQGVVLHDIGIELPADADGTGRGED